MDDTALLKAHYRDPEDSWEPLLSTAKVINGQVSAYKTAGYSPPQAARDIDAISRPLMGGEAGSDTDGFLWEFWETVIRLSQSYGEKTEAAQAVILDIMEQLKGLGGDWSELRVLGPSLTELRNRTSTPDGIDEFKQKVVERRLIGEWGYTAVAPV